VTGERVAGDLRSALLGTAGLTAACLVALVLTLTRGPVTATREQRVVVARLAAFALLAQAAHFAEELATGFNRQFPEVLGLAPWSAQFFVAFNAVWLAIWSLSIPAVGCGFRPALFPLWFLGIGSVLNGVAHPLLALRAGGYFPGLLTCPLVAVAGVLLLGGLARLTR